MRCLADTWECALGILHLAMIGARAAVHIQVLSIGANHDPVEGVIELGVALLIRLGRYQRRPHPFAGGIGLAFIHIRRCGIFGIDITHHIQRAIRPKRHTRRDQIRVAADLGQRVYFVFSRRITRLDNQLEDIGLVAYIVDHTGLGIALHAHHSTAGLNDLANLNITMQRLGGAKNRRRLHLRGWRAGRRGSGGRRNSGGSWGGCGRGRARHC